MKEGRRNKQGKGRMDLRQDGLQGLQTESRIPLLELKSRQRPKTAGAKAVPTSQDGSSQEQK